jgi:hypothetical protein
VWAQTPAPAAKPPAAKPAATAPAQGQEAPENVRTIETTVPVDAVVPISKLPPATVIGTINGRKVSAGELQVVLRSLPAQVQQQAQSDRRRFLEQYGVLMHLAEEARKAKLDQQSPYKEALEYGAMQILYQAAINQKMQEMPVTLDDAKKKYETAKDSYIQAKVKAIYLPFSNAPASTTDPKGKKVATEAEAKVKAEDLVKKLRAGADFAQLAKENSGDAASAQKGGDFGYIKKSESIPPELKDAIFNAKPGTLTDPIRQPSGFYIFKVEEIAPETFEQVQGAITSELKNTQFVAWLTSLQKSLDIKLQSEAPAAVEPMSTPKPPASK